jgi:hypothetical protein
MTTRIDSDTAKPVTAFGVDEGGIGQDQLAGIVAFRSAKVRTFAERKATIIIARRLNRTKP